MITTEDVLNMNFYKKETFTGSYKGMRYLLKKDTEEEAAIFRCYVWPGPYNFATTPDEQKSMATFPFNLFMIILLYGSLPYCIKCELKYAELTFAY